MNIGISDKNRGEVVELLNRLLSDEYVLYTKTRNYHWNVTGLDFSEHHKFFEAQYEELNEIIDEVAERARTLGGKAFGTLKEFLGETRLKEFPGQYPKVQKMFSNLLEDHEVLINLLRTDLQACAEKYGDAGTSDFMTALMEKHEKMAWMLRSFLQ